MTSYLTKHSWHGLIQTSKDKMAFIIIIVAAGLFGLIQIFKIKDKFAKVINLLYAIAIGVSLIPLPQIAIDGFYLFGITHLVVLFYVFHNEEFANEKKAIISTMAVIQLLATLFWLMQYPYANLIFLMGAITLITFIFITVKRIQDYKNEIGFLTVLAADGLIKCATVFLSISAQTV